MKKVYLDLTDGVRYDLYYDRTTMNTVFIMERIK
jgi:hypothetical protein